MLAFSKLFRRMYPLAIFAIFLFQIGVKMTPSQVSQRAETSSAAQPISLVVWTDQGKYSLGNSVKVNAALQNNSDKPVYVDRRMFWTGFGGGLKLEIRDEQGKSLPARALSDAIMPPPKEGDTSILIPLDEGFLYGTSGCGLKYSRTPRPRSRSHKSTICKEVQLRRGPP